MVVITQAWFRLPSPVLSLSFAVLFCLPSFLSPVLLRSFHCLCKSSLSLTFDFLFRPFSLCLEFSFLCLFFSVLFRFPFLSRFFVFLFPSSLIYVSWSLSRLFFFSCLLLVRNCLKVLFMLMLFCSLPFSCHPLSLLLFAIAVLSLWCSVPSLSFPFKARSYDCNHLKSPDGRCVSSGCV